MEALAEMKKGDPTKAVFGLSLPSSWKGELAKYAMNGDLRRMFHVKAITFEGAKISRLEPPKQVEAES